MAVLHEAPFSLPGSGQSPVPPNVAIPGPSQNWEQDWLAYSFPSTVQRLQRDFSWAEVVQEVLKAKQIFPKALV